MKKLFQSIDIAPIVAFRIFFGVLFALETFGAILTGWVKANFIDPKFTFAHIGFDWLQPLPGYGMYIYFCTMGILSVAVALGYRYKLSISMLTLLWAGSYLMQKTSYNNHYYLLLLVGLMMCFLPAHRYKSLDVKQGRVTQLDVMPNWCRWVMIAQIAIVYFFATVAKFYPDWLNGTFIKNLLSNSTPFESVNEFFSQKWFYMFISYMGIIFDGLIVPALLYKRTRTLAVLASLTFHLFNSLVLQIGIFPYFALSYAVFFYEPDKIRQIFFKSKPSITTLNDNNPTYINSLKYFFIPFLIVQLILPLRHWFIKGDVLLTEEGHRLSWRMMLRSKDGYTFFKVVDKSTNKVLKFNVSDYVTSKQYSALATKPDLIWQMAQRIKSMYLQEGKDVAVFASTEVSINGKPYVKLIDESVDLGSVSWDYFWHSDWVLLPQNKKEQ